MVHANEVLSTEGMSDGELIRSFVAGMLERFGNRLEKKATNGEAAAFVAAFAMAGSALFTGLGVGDRIDQILNSPLDKQGWMHRLLPEKLPDGTWILKSRAVDLDLDPRPGHYKPMDVTFYWSNGTDRATDLFAGDFFEDMTGRPPTLVEMNRALHNGPAVRMFEATASSVEGGVEGQLADIIHRDSRVIDENMRIVAQSLRVYVDLLKTGKLITKTAEVAGFVTTLSVLGMVAREVMTNNFQEWSRRETPWRWSAPVDVEFGGYKLHLPGIAEQLKWLAQRLRKTTT